MLLYLPIAETALSPFMLFGMGLVVGFIAGMFGVGGGFLLTPLLIFAGIPPSVAVASQAPQIVASSFSGTLSYWKRKLIDFKLSYVMLMGGFAGVMCGILVFNFLRKYGQLDLVISFSYLIMLGIIGSIMLNESIRSIFKLQKPNKAGRKTSLQLFAQHLPMQLNFDRAEVQTSGVFLIAVGFFIGFAGAVLGIGGGFILVPALIYIFRVPTTLSIGTSLFQTTIIMAMATITHSLLTKELDILLALLLMIGGVTGAQFGAQAGKKLKAEQLRALLALIILAVAIRFGLSLIIKPEEIFSLQSY